MRSQGSPSLLLPSPPQQWHHHTRAGQHRALKIMVAAVPQMKQPFPLCVPPFLPTGLRIDLRAHTVS